MSLLPTYKETQKRRFLTPGVFDSYFHKGITAGLFMFFVILIVAKKLRVGPNNNCAQTIDRSMLNSDELKFFFTLKDSMMLKHITLSITLQNENTFRINLATWLRMLQSAE